MRSLTESEQFDQCVTTKCRKYQAKLISSYGYIPVINEKLPAWEVRKEAYIRSLWQQITCAYKCEKSDLD